MELALVEAVQERSESINASKQSIHNTHVLKQTNEYVLLVHGEDLTHHGMMVALSRACFVTRSPGIPEQ